jgi:hypothetical protein
MCLVAFGSTIALACSELIETQRTHRSFTAKTAKNAKTIAKDIALLTHRTISLRAFTSASMIEVGWVLTHLQRRSARHHSPTPV